MHEVTEQTSRGVASIHKGAARLAIEKVMRRATRDNPVSVPQIVKRTGYEKTIVRTHVGNIVGNCLAYNLNPGKRGGALYAWRTPNAALGDFPAPRVAVTSASFTGTKWRIREGGADHLRHLSRRGDDYVEHRAPIPMAGFVDAVGVHGGRAP